MEDLLRYIAHALVDEPERVEVAWREDTLVLKVAEPDRGKIIGRQGRTIKSMRTLFTAIGSRQGRNVALQVAE